MTEAEYRALEIDSYSSIKVFLDDRKKYYKTYILREKEEERTESTIFGDLVDCLQFTPDEYENRFALSIVQAPTGQYAKLVNKLMDITLRSIDEHGEVYRDLDEMLRMAYEAVKFDKDGNIVDFKRDSFEAAKLRFIGSELEDYYRQMRESHGKQLIELSVLEEAQKIVEDLRTNWVTREIMGIVTNRRFEVHHQFPIIGFLDTDTGRIPLKCLIDKLVIDHENKIIHIYDLKTAWDFMDNYFKYKYYIQMAVYYYLVIQWKRSPELKDYHVEYPSFIVADNTSYKNPLIYYTTEENFSQGFDGFTIRGRYYPGFKRAIQDIAWHKETGIWNISKDNYQSGGKVAIKPFI